MDFGALEDRSVRRECVCFGMKTRGNILDYENICPNCQKRIVKDAIFNDFLDLHRTMVVDGIEDSDNPEPVYDNPGEYTEQVTSPTQTTSAVVTSVLGMAQDTGPS